MSELLDRLKLGLAESQKKQAEVLKHFQVVQAEYQTVTAEVVGYQKVLEIETRREHQQSTVVHSLIPESPKEPEPEVNKTQLIKDLLAARPGMKPNEVFKALEGKIAHQYVYSVLKRLKDKKQVIERRGKYYLPAVAAVAAQEDGKKDQHGLLQ